jgi:two-component system, NtrC family, sensor kinase
MSRGLEAEDGQDFAPGRPGARESRSPPPAALRRAADRFRHLPGVEVVWLAVRESRGASAVIRCGAGLRGTDGLMVTIQAGHGLGGQILQGATKPILASLEDEGAFSDTERAFLAGEDVTSAIVVPLVNPGVRPGELRVDGLVYAGRRDGSPFGTAIVARATELAGQVAFEVRFAQRLQEATHRWDRLLHDPTEPDGAAGRLERLAKEIAADARGTLRAGLAIVYRLDRGLGLLHSLAIAGLHGVPEHLMPILRRGQVLSPGWGSTGEAVAWRRPCIVHEYGPDTVRVPPSMTDALPRMNTFTTLAVPLLAGGDVIGAITLARYVSMGGFVKRETRAAMRLAFEAAPRVARALAAVEHAHRRHGGAILTRLAGSLTQSQGEAAVCEQLAASVLGLVQGREVMVWDAEGHPLIPGLPLARILGHPHERRLERLREEAWRTRQPAWTPDLYNDHRLADPVVPEAEDAEAARAVLVAPVRIQDTLLAWVAVATDTAHTFTPAEWQLVQALADQAVLGIANARACDELERSRAAQIKQERLVAMGRLAAWVAHELRNPLQNLVALIAELRDRPPDGGWHGVHVADHQQILERARAEAGRAAGIVDRMLGALREPSLMVEATDLAQLAEEAVALVAERAAAQGVVVRVTSAAARLPLAADPVLLRQVVYNILSNALDAIDGSGQIEVTLRQQRDPNGVARTVVAVHDTGRGIARDDLPHVFDLFFTRKPTGEGLGLGLAMCQTVVERHGGAIVVDSSGPGLGTTVEFWLPTRHE